MWICVGNKALTRSFYYLRPGYINCLNVSEKIAYLFVSSRELSLRAEEVPCWKPSLMFKQSQNTLVNENSCCWHHFFTIFLENYVYYHSLNVWNWYLPPKVIVRVVLEQLRLIMKWAIVCEILRVCVLKIWQVHNLWRLPPSTFFPFVEQRDCWCPLEI